MLITVNQLKNIINNYLNENDAKKEFHDHILFNKADVGPMIGGMAGYTTDALIVLIDDLIKEGEVDSDIYDLLNDVFGSDPKEMNLDEDTLSELLDFQKKLFAQGNYFASQKMTGASYESLGLNVNPDDLEMDKDYIPFEKAPEVYFKILNKKLEAAAKAEEEARKKKEKQAAEKANLERIKNFKPTKTRCNPEYNNPNNFSSTSDSEKSRFITCYLYSGKLSFEPYLWDELGKNKNLSKKLTNDMKTWLIDDYAKRNKIPAQHKHKIKFGQYIYPEDLD
jgi:hypothetical protein